MTWDFIFWNTKSNKSLINHSENIIIRNNNNEIKRLNKDSIKYNIIFNITEYILNAYNKYLIKE